MDTRSLNGLLFLALVFVVALLASGKLQLSDLWPDRLAVASIRWRLAWMALGAAIAFIFVWGKKLAPDKAFWGMIICLLLAFLLF